eukprot:CAMPEP_0181498524 /NCGR_PEP_ID=MMETSP1110-20121109/54149_1 /TAXON_ID=174948 /ORGANISM="Symbiodinium sp., Strain CCMP421" /LENGTH=57 /DNA_ID=CAMNT_0023626605 /DNA_START=58 /DNA_END=228 /DNA_ORIENTATION=-
MNQRALFSPEALADVMSGKTSSKTEGQFVAIHLPNRGHVKTAREGHEIRGSACMEQQ